MSLQDMDKPWWCFFSLTVQWGNLQQVISFCCYCLEGTQQNKVHPVQPVFPHATLLFSALKSKRQTST